MIFEYDVFDYKDTQTGKIEKRYLPFLNLTFSKRGFRLFSIKCLLDSGADVIIFPSSFADYFHIPYKDFSKEETIVAGGGRSFLYEAPFKKHGITMFTLDTPIRDRIFFSEGQAYPLLGQEFFKYFRITFDASNKVFDVNVI